LKRDSEVRDGKIDSGVGINIIGQADAVTEGLKSVSDKEWAGSKKKASNASKIVMAVR
jgi:hypothetical protein